MGSLVCRVELHKEDGLRLSVFNEDGKVTQTVLLDGSAITLTCQGEEATSIVRQKPESIAIDCKDFSLNAETITLTSTKQSRYESQATIDLKSSKDMNLTSQAALNARASADTSLKGRNVSLSADSKADVKGSRTQITSTGNTEVSGATLSLSGSTKAEMDGLQVTISSKGIMDLEATGIASLKGQMTNIKGTLVKIG